MTPGRRRIGDGDPTVVPHDRPARKGARQPRPGRRVVFTGLTGQQGHSLSSQDLSGGNKAQVCNFQGGSRLMQEPFPLLLQPLN